MRVLLVEDDPMLGHAVEQALRDASYAVDWLRDGRSASAALAHHGFELILLDLGLPLRDGLEVLRELRSRDDSTPVLVITARDAVQQRIEGLDHGADDYLVKPFAVGELLARMRALGRRRAGTGAPVLGNGILALDPASKAVTVSGIEHALSNREFALLRELLVRPGAVLVARRARGPDLRLGRRGREQRDRVHHPLAAQEARAGDHSQRPRPRLDGRARGAGGREPP